MGKNNSQPRRVDFLLFKEDFECAYLAALGVSTRKIQEETGLTPGRITYRCKKASIKRSDYRNGDSVFFRITYCRLRPIIAPELTKYLKVHAT